MLSIPSTLSLHRATRALYMDAARRARSQARAWVKASGSTVHFPSVEYESEQIVFHTRAEICFLRRARQANWKLVAVKRFAREFEVGRGNLLKVGDDSAWGDL